MADIAQPTVPPIPSLEDIKKQQTQTTPLSVQLAEQYRNLLGDAPTVGYTPITPMYQNLQPTTITGLPDEYFNSQKDQLKSQLRDEFFGKNGNWDQSMSNESAAGRLDSGVGRQMLQKTVTDPFIKATADIDRTILQSVMSERARVESYNADQIGKYNELLGHAFEVDSTNKMAAEQATANLRSEYNKLYTSLADAEAGRMSQEGIAQLEANIRMFQSVIEDKRKADALAVEQEKNRMEDFRQMQQNQIDYLRTPMKGGTQAQQSTGAQLTESFGGGGGSTGGGSQSTFGAQSYSTDNAPSDFPKVGTINPRTGQRVGADNGDTFRAPNGVNYMLVLGADGKGNWIALG